MPAYLCTYIEYSTIALDSLYQPGAIVTVKIYYRHNNIDDGPFNVSGGMVLPIANPKVQENGIRGDRPSDKATLDLYARTRYVNLPNGRLADSTNTEQKLCIAGAAATRFQHISLLFAKVNYNLDIVYWHKNSIPMTVCRFVSIPMQEKILPTQNAHHSDDDTVFAIVRRASI